MKKFLKISGVIIGLSIVLLMTISVIIIIFIDKKMVENQMKRTLNRHITIESINTGIFSAISGIEVKDAAISNFKTKNQIKALEGKPVQAEDLFVYLDAFYFKIKLLPLLEKKIILHELILYKPKINIVKSKAGKFNFDDLVEKKKNTLNKENEPVNMSKKIKDPDKIEEEELTADKLYFSINIKSIGIKNGTLNIYDKKKNQSFMIYNLTALLHSINIDPGDLENKNIAKIKLNMGFKTIGSTKIKSVKAFDIGFALNGNIIPFDKKTGKIKPEISVRVQSPYGNAERVKIIDKLKNIGKLQKYIGKIFFLKDNQTWINSYVDIWYKNGLVKMQNGKVKTDNFSLQFEGLMNINTKKLNFDMEMILDKKHKLEIRNGLMKNIRKAIAGKLAKAVNRVAAADFAMQPLLNKDGNVYFKFKITGTSNSPDTRIVHPRVLSILKIIRNPQWSPGDVLKKRREARKERRQKRRDRIKKILEGSSED